MITRIHESRTQYVTVQSKALATQTQSYDKTTTSTSTESVPAKSASAIFYILLTFLLNTIKSITCKYLLLLDKLSGKSKIIIFISQHKQIKRN